MKNTLLLLFAFFSPALFAQVMTVTVDQDDFLVCPDEIVEVAAARSTTANNSLQFDGATDYLEIPNNAAFNIGTSTNFTIEFWVLTNNTTNTEYLAVYRNATGQGWAIFKNGNGTIGFAARDNALPPNLDFVNPSSVTAPTIDDGNWHHVAVIWNRGSTEATIYVDGSFAYSNSGFNVPGDISHSDPITLGYGIDPTGSPTYLDGEIDEFRIWKEDRISPIDHIPTYWKAHLNPSSFSNLAVNFDFNELTDVAGWEDCAAGIIAPNGTTTPSVNTMGGPPGMSFNFSYNWTNTSGNTQAGANYQKSFTRDDTVVVEAGYCKYYCTDTVYIALAECDTLRDPRDVAAVFAPSAFTPNGDTKNDVYLVKANAITYFEMQIYNRDGNILFHSKDINTGWNGTFNDKSCYEGVYIAQIMYRDVDGVEFIKYQQFSLMR
ncbi:MAG: T9SS type B sorting domain-containing protein [Flavobacteriales bacterium]|nr:T9SS type B sorting domain-containing protein [Flavobacteriales bacterium]